MKKKILLIVLDFIIIFSFIGIIVEYKNINDYKKYVKEQEISLKLMQEELELIRQNHNKLEEYREHYNNNDIVGSIKIDGTKIDSLLVKGKDNDYYLNHGVNGKYDEKGTIYVDYRTPLNSKQINIYGHNSWYYDIPFRDLEKYFEKDFYNEHKYIKIWTGISDVTYEIFSVQIVTNDYEHMIVEPKDFKLHIDKLSKSLYDTGVEVTEKDDILILQTCNFHPKDTYIVISAKKI